MILTARTLTPVPENTILQLPLKSEGLLSDEVIMRIEATVPQARGVALTELAEELCLSRSQVLDEALALYMNVVMEVRRGRRLVTLGSKGSADIIREIVTPTLAQIEWTAHRQSLVLSNDALQKVAELVDNPPEAPEALRKLMAAETR